MSFQRLYSQSATDVPLIYEKLTNLCERSDELFTGFKNTELLDGRHYIEAIIGDKYFTHVSAETKAKAKDELAIKVYKYYGVDRPLKDPAANLIAQTNMLAFWNPLTVAQTYLSDRLVVTFAGETDLTYKLEAKYIAPIDEQAKKKQKTEILVGEGYGCSAASASYKIGVEVLKSEKFRDSYIKWVKNGKKGCYEDVDSIELLEENSDILKDWNLIEKCEITETKVLHDLKILCEAYELEEPKYYKKDDEVHNETEYLCSVSSVSKNEKLETGCLQAFEHLKEVCACRDRLVAEKVAKQEQERHAEMQSKVLAAVQRKREMEEFARKKQTDKEDKQLRHTQWILECASKKKERLDKQHKSVIERKRVQMRYAGKELDKEIEDQLMIDLECGISETAILKENYIAGNVDPSLLEERLKRKEEAKRKHESLLKQHFDQKTINETNRQARRDQDLAKRMEKESRRLAHEAEKFKTKIDKTTHHFEYVCEYDGSPVFTSDSLMKAYGDEITNNPISEINELVNKMFAGYQKEELVVTQLDNKFSNNGQYYEAKIDTLKTVAYGRYGKDAKRVALQALVLAIKNGGDLEDGFVDQLSETGILSGGDHSTIHRAHPVHQINIARTYFNQTVKYLLDVEQPRWTMVCHFGDLTAIGHDETKALAKAKSAEEMLPLILEKYGSMEEAKFNTRKRRNLKMGEARKARRALEKRELVIAENTNLDLE